MQINGSQLPAIIRNAPDTAQNDRSRVPVVIDAEPVFEAELNTEQKALSQSLAPDVSTPNQSPINTDERQQAQFVRNFSSQAEPSSSENLPAVIPPELPRGVKAYLQNAQLTATVQEPLIDEIV